MNNPEEKIIVTQAELQKWLLDCITEYKRDYIDSKDPVVEAVRKDLLDRSTVGIEKYGTTLAQNKGDLRYWLQHQYEELLDAANYCKRAIMELESKEIPANVYYVYTSDNFYCRNTRMGMGTPFYNEWISRKDDFPKA